MAGRRRGRRRGGRRGAGILEPALLLLLHHGPAHGYTLLEQLEDYGLGDLNSSIHDTMDSVHRLRNVPAKVWLASHEAGVFEEEPGIKWDQYLAIVGEREEKLKDLLRNPRTFEQIVGASIIYGRPREPKMFFELGERGHMKKHLEKLIMEGLVVKDGEYYASSQ